MNAYNTQKPGPKLSAKDLSFRVDNVKSLVVKSFFPSPDTKATPAEKYNYEIYCSFKAYNDILIEQKVVFPPFNAEFENILGARLLELFIPQTLTSASQIEKQLQNAFDAADMIGAALVENGFIASWERSVPSNEDIEDFIDLYVSDDNFYVASDLKYTLALMGDITQKSQLLLQELGYRLYPSFGRWTLRQKLLACFPESVTVNVDDYYMDTAYNSDPNLFEVRQILLNIVLQRD